MESSEYAQAEELFNSLDDYKDAADKVLECKYQYAQFCVDAKSPDIPEAVRIYEELGDYGDAKAQLETLKKKYFYPDYDYRIPALECVMTGSQHKSAEESSEKLGSYHEYSYEWRYDDHYASASNLSEGFSEWISYINENFDDLKAKEKGANQYTIYLDNKEVGTVISVIGSGFAFVNVLIYEKPAD